MCWYRYGSFHIQQLEVSVTLDGKVDASDMQYTRARRQRRWIPFLLV